MLLITDKQVIINHEGKYVRRKVDFVIARNIIAQHTTLDIQTTPEGIKAIYDELGLFLESDTSNYSNHVAMAKDCNIAVQLIENEIYIIERSL